MAEDEPRPEQDEGDEDRRTFPVLEPPVELPPDQTPPRRLRRGYTLPIEPVDPT
jgi:hypothetical protein